MTVAHGRPIGRGRHQGASGPARRAGRRWRPVALLGAWLFAPVASGIASASSFVTFESGQVRPLALSPDGSRLFAVNTPDNRLEIFTVGAGGLTHAASVPVGLEPVAVAARTDTEVWVVNHLSDSVSIVDAGATPPRVRDTLFTCDEPRDIVFAGPGGTRAFITTARRGQNCPVPFNATTPGLGRAVVQVFDATNLGTSGTPGGVPLANVVLFGDTPRALARSADGSTVYAAIFHSGNQTTALNEGAVCNGGASAPPCNVGGQLMPGGLPAPNINVQGITGPENGLVVGVNPLTGNWEDNIGRNWTPAVRFSLPDLDVFAIDAQAAVPAQTASFAHVGTVLFNMVTNPVSGVLYVSNTEANNRVRFEGPGTAFGNTTVQGHLHEARITVIDGGGVQPRHLNKHIDYAQRPAPSAVKARSLSTPLGMAVTSNGATLYVAAFGSNKLGVFSTSALEHDTFVPNASSHIPLSGGGPTGVVLDEARDRLYTFTRFDNAISVVRLSTATEIAHLPVYNPEPAHVVQGRRFLYDAVHTSSNGEASCASCHVFGDFDSLSWDLGNPDEDVLNNPIPTRIPPIGGTFANFHPLKGPMATQSLRGMANHGSMHWRGDRTGGNDPGGDPFDEDAAFKKFNPAFVGLVGRNAELTAAEMQAFTDFILEVTYPPNPIRLLDNSLRPAEQSGRNLYFGRITDTLFNCNGCHTLNPAQGFFGSDGFTTFEGETQMFKVAHLRNVYTKIGMFGVTGSPHQGPQVRGVGILHDGSVDTVFRFLGAGVFTLTVAERRQLEQFVLAFDSNMAPIVGQQTTLTGTNAATVGPRINLLIARAAANECQAVVKGTVAGLQRGWVRLPSGQFRSDREGEPLLSDAEVRALATTPGQELTYTCVPPGSGVRIGIDRDEDGFLDRDELDAGTNPADPASFPGAPTLVQTTSLTLRDRSAAPADPAKRKVTFKSSTRKDPAPNRIVPPAVGGPSDPTLGGATLTVYNGLGLTTDEVTVVLPAADWQASGGGGYRFKSRSGPIRAVVLKSDLLTVRGGKAEWSYTLDEPQQGRVAVRLVLAGGEAWCADAPAKASGNPPSTARSDRVDRFVAQKKTPAPAACPAVAGSPSGAFVVGAGG